jgi:LemA protein
MNKMIALGCLGVVVLVGLVLLLVGVAGYNHLNALNQATNSQWANVQSLYQRRSDLIPNLVQTVAGSANFEKSTLEDVTNARASVGRVTIDASHAPDDAAKLQEFQQAQGQLSNALSRLLVVSENYPQLRSTEGFRELQAQLEGTENRISVARNDFNAAVQAYDTSVHAFPAVLYAGLFGFHDKPYFQADASAQTAPSVHFYFNAPANK